MLDNLFDLIRKSVICTFFVCCDIYFEEIIHHVCLGYITTNIGFGLNFVVSSYIQSINDIAQYEHSGVIFIHNTNL